jgi:hypothetical protein
MQIEVKRAENKRLMCVYLYILEDGCIPVDRNDHSIIIRPLNKIETTIVYIYSRIKHI